jgi:4a-hydroxytetrahydrobiopterin dehydratase
VLSDSDVDTRLADSAWQRKSNALTREWKLADFAAAIAFVNRVADLSEQANHHPDIDLHGWNKVSLRLSTHSEGHNAGRPRHGRPHRCARLSADALATVVRSESMSEEDKPPRSSLAPTGTQPADRARA